jgi:hypothetical protein
MVFAAGPTANQHHAAATTPAFASLSSAPPQIALLAGAPSLLRHYRALALVVLLTAAAGISAAVVHYREHKPVAAIPHKPSAEAQDLYLRGRYYWNLRTEDGLNCAVDLFTQSIVNDPHYAAAYAGLADAYLLLRQYGHMPDTEAYPRALAAALQAIALDDSSPEAHRSLAFILRFWDWDIAAQSSLTPTTPSPTTGTPPRCCPPDAPARRSRRSTGRAPSNRNRSPCSPIAV